MRLYRVGHSRKKSRTCAFLLTQNVRVGEKRHLTKYSLEEIYCDRVTPKHINNLEL